MSTSCVEVFFFSNFDILVSILFGPEDLLSLRDYIMEIISSLTIRVIKKELKHLSMKLVSAIFI